MGNVSGSSDAAAKQAAEAAAKRAAEAAARKAAEAAARKAAEAAARKAAEAAARKAAETAAAKKQAGISSQFNKGPQQYFKPGKDNRPSTGFDPRPLSPSQRAPSKSGYELTAEKVKELKALVSHVDGLAGTLAPNAKKALDSVNKLLSGDVTTKQGLEQLNAMLSTGKAAAELAGAVSELTKSIPKVAETVLKRQGLDPAKLNSPEAIEAAQKALEKSPELKALGDWAKDLGKISTLVKGVTGPVEGFNKALTAFRGVDATTGKQLSLLERAGLMKDVPGAILDGLPLARSVAIGAQKLFEVGGLKTAADCAKYFRGMLGKLDKVAGAPLEKVVAPLIEKMAPDAAKEFIKRAALDLGNPQFVSLFAKEGSTSLAKSLASAASRWAGPLSIGFEVAKLEAQISLAAGAKMYNAMSSYLTVKAMGTTPDRAIAALKAADVMSPEGQAAFIRTIQARDYLPGTEWRTHLEHLTRNDPKLAKYLNDVKNNGIHGAATQEQYQMAARLREEAVKYIQDFVKQVGKW